MVSLHFTTDEQKQTQTLIWMPRFSTLSPSFSFGFSLCRSVFGSYFSFGRFFVQRKQTMSFIVWPQNAHTHTHMKYRYCVHLGSRCEVLNIPLVCYFISCFGIILFFPRLMKIVMDNFSFPIFIIFSFCVLVRSKLFVKMLSPNGPTRPGVNLVSLCVLCVAISFLKLCTWNDIIGHQKNLKRFRYHFLRFDGRHWIAMR